MDGERVTNIMHARAVTPLAATGPAHQAKQPGDPALDAHEAVRSAAWTREQRCLRARRRPRSLSLLQIGVKAGEQTGGDREQTGLAEFPGPDVEHRLVMIEIAELEADGFADPETGRVEEEQERDVRVRTQPAGQAGRRRDERPDLLLRVDVRMEAGRHSWRTGRVRNEHRRIGTRAEE